VPLLPYRCRSCDRMPRLRPRPRPRRGRGHPARRGDPAADRQVDGGPRDRDHPGRPVARLVGAPERGGRPSPRRHGRLGGHAAAVLGTPASSRSRPHLRSRSGVRPASRTWSGPFLWLCARWFCARWFCFRRWHARRGRACGLWSRRFRSRAGRSRSCVWACACVRRRDWSGAGVWFTGTVGDSAAVWSCASGAAFASE
jgi:hypothetical protein